MTKTYTVKLSQDAHKLVSKMEHAAQKNGVHLVGDTISGHFKGKGIEGRYEISENLLAITIAKKPVFLTWSLIETTVMQFFVNDSEP
ncbi:MAG TPA: hypothetical protein VLU73_03485 [Methylococcaceae bacterium]|jgi:hypothetical protein|nr:hypothetical protein [Methylococcaceae bacterium]